MAFQARCSGDRAFGEHACRDDVALGRRLQQCDG